MKIRDLKKIVDRIDEDTDGEAIVMVRTVNGSSLMKNYMLSDDISRITNMKQIL